MTGRQMEALRDALCSAFNQKSFDQMLQLRLDKNRENFVESGDLQTVVFEVIQLAVREGWSGELIHAAVSYNPRNAALRRFSEEYAALVSKGTDSESATKDRQYRLFRLALLLTLPFILAGLVAPVRVSEIPNTSPLPVDPNSAKRGELQDKISEAESNLEALDNHARDLTKRTLASLESEADVREKMVVCRDLINENLSRFDGMIPVKPRERLEAGKRKLEIGIRRWDKGWFSRFSVVAMYEKEAEQAGPEIERTIIEWGELKKAVEIFLQSAKRFTKSEGELKKLAADFDRAISAFRTRMKAEDNPPRLMRLIRDEIYPRCKSLGS